MPRQFWKGSWMTEECGCDKHCKLKGRKKESRSIPTGADAPGSLFCMFGWRGDAPTISSEPDGTERGCPQTVAGTPPHHCPPIIHLFVLSPFPKRCTEPAKPMPGGFSALPNSSPRGIPTLHRHAHESSQPLGEPQSSLHIPDSPLPREASSDATTKEVRILFQLLQNFLTLYCSIPSLFLFSLKPRSCFRLFFKTR